MSVRAQELVQLNSESSLQDLKEGKINKKSLGDLFLNKQTGLLV